MAEPKRKTIRRAPKDAIHRYFPTLRSTAQNKTLSYDALGMLSYLLSKPDDWEVQPRDLVRDGCQLGKVYRLLRELRKVGHVTLEKIRNDKGRIVAWEYLVYENPCPLIENPQVDLQQVDLPLVENRYTTYTESTDTENTETREEIAGSVEPAPTSKRKSKNDPETNKAVAAIIKAYIDGLWPKTPVTDQYNHNTNRQAALDIFKAGYTCEQVKACVKDKSKEEFWSTKLIPLKTIANDIAAWQHAKGNGNGNGALPDWWPRDHYQRPHKYDPPLSDQEYAWAELYHATVLNDQWHCREKWPQLVAAHLKTQEAAK